MRVFDDSQNEILGPNDVTAAKFVRSVLIVIFGIKQVWNFVGGSYFEDHQSSCETVDIFQDNLNKLRQIDDKILFELNTALPSRSFSANVDKGEKCRLIYKEVALNVLA